MDKHKLGVYLAKTGIKANEKQLESFVRYYDEMIAWNKKCNLTSITEPEEVMLKHFCDSLLIMRSPLWQGRGRLLDIGTGAGFPAVPLKIINPELEVVLVDALNKRVEFLRSLIETLELKRVTVIHSRAEDLKKVYPGKGSFDYVVSRAVAKLAVLAEYMLPFVCIGGYAIVYKGPESDEEIRASVNALKILGGKITGELFLELPQQAGKRRLIIISKEHESPAQYPRKAGTPEKKPL